MSKKWLFRCTLAATAILLVASAGCDESPTAPIGEPVLEVSTTQGEYAPGDLIELRVTNVGARPLSVWLCGQLQRRGLTGWLTVPREEGLPCLDMLNSLQPGDTRQFWYDLPISLPAGTYRIHLSTAYDENEARLAISSRISNPFEVHALE